jgi:hypothetical protein
VPRPQMGDRGRRNEIGCALPYEQEFDKSIEPLRCFT